MEIAIRQQISDAKSKEQQLYEKEDELRRIQLEQLTEFEEQKKLLVEERKWLESVRDEVDSKFGSRQSNHATPPIQPKKQTRPRKPSCSDMPRQMPVDIERQIKKEEDKRNRLLDLVTSYENEGQPAHPNDLSIDQANQLDMLLSN